MPKLSDAELTALAADLNQFAQAQEEFGGKTITVRPEDVTLASGGSLTDANGNVFTLQHMTGDFANSGQLANVYENGQLLTSGQTLGGGFWVALRLVDGVVLAENGKGIGWFGPDRAGADDPGPGDNATTPVETTEDPAPVVTPDDQSSTHAQDPPAPTDSADDTPPSTDHADDTVSDHADDTVSDDTVSDHTDGADATPSDVVHAFYLHAHHHQEHRMNFVSKATDTVNAVNTATSVASVTNVTTASVTSTAAAAVTDICSTANVVAATGTVASRSNDWHTTDTSTVTQHTLIADCTPARHHEQVVTDA